MLTIKRKGWKILTRNASVFYLKHNIKKFTATNKKASKVNSQSIGMEW